MIQEPLFDEGSTSVHSRLFVVHPGRKVILSAWGFPRNKVKLEPGEHKNTQSMAIVQKVLVKTSGSVDGAPCDSVLLDPDIKFSYVEDVTQCGLWHLSACQNTVVLTLPGAYRLQLNDEGALGSVFIAASNFSNTDLPEVPAGLVLGNNF